MPDSAEFWITFMAFLAGAGLAGVMAWLERQPRKSLTPRLLPTTPFLFAGGIVAIIALVHLVNLFGVHTGRFR
jgi:hypothetical protein